MSFQGLQPQRRILILYADTGSGHRSVACAIQCAVREMSPAVHDVACAVVRLHNPVAHHPLGHLFDLYGPVTRHAQRLYAGAYHISDSKRVCEVSGRIAYHLLNKELTRLIETAQPDLIVCVHSLLTRPVLQVLRRGAHKIPLFTVVTDLASIHQSWIVPEVDHCFAPTPEARDELLRRGMRSAQVRLSGLPVHPSFAAPADSDRTTLRLTLGLRPDVFTVLVMGGGEGVGGLERIASRLAESGLPLQLIVVAGRNPTLFRRLSKRQRAWRLPHRVFGYAQNVPNLMRASDVLVTKAGSVTIAEALACELPIIVSSVIEGQESGNIDLLVRNGVGCLARTPDEVVEAVHRLQRLGADGIDALSGRARRLSAPTAAFAVASQILVTLEEPPMSVQENARELAEPIFA